jgi:hypothetical protein
MDQADKEDAERRACRSLSDEYVHFLYPPPFSSSIFICFSEDKENKAPKKGAGRKRCKPTNDDEVPKDDDDEDGCDGTWWFGPGGKKVRVSPFNLL